MPAWISTGAMIVLACAAAATSQAASSSTVVSATVPSATSLIATGCAAGVAGRTDFGSVLPGSSAVTTSDCAVVFGSSNDTSQLRISQSDSLGLAMWSPTRGALDTSFDGDGRVTTATAPGAADDMPFGVVVQPDGRIVTGGRCDMGGANGLDACLARYNPDGSLDTTFDTDGRVTTAITLSGGAFTYDEMFDIALQADGRVVIVGRCWMGAATSDDMCLARYNQNGSLDSSFDGDGRVTTAIAPTNGGDWGIDVAVQADGRIVSVGFCAMGAASGTDICVARYNTDGSLDTSFDGDGRVSTAVGPAAAGDVSYAVTIQANGRILVAGYCDMGIVSGLDFCAARYMPDGSLDTSFDGDGRVVTAIAPGAGNDVVWDVAVQTDGRIVASGYCDMGGATGTDACLARYNSNGSLDNTFDSDGRVTANSSPVVGGADYALTVAVQSDDRIVAAGPCDMGVSTGSDVCVLRFSPDGSLDATFDGDGRVATATAPAAGTDGTYALALQPDGRVVTAGYCSMGGATGQDACLASYDENGLVSQYADDGVSDWDTAGTAPRLFGACLRSVSGGATAQWTANATCPAIDGTYWNAVPAASTKLAYNTALEPDPADATVNLRFGMRASGNQPPGGYVAPITFEVLAPNA